jgi:hypothetical protein
MDPDDGGVDSIFEIYVSLLFKPCKNLKPTSVLMLFPEVNTS